MSSREARSYRRLYEETRYVFCAGSFGGYAMDFVKGVYKERRFAGGLEAGRKKGPQFAGHSFVISSTFYTVEHILEAVRQKDDVFNQIIAGAASIGLVNIRGGFLFATVCAALAGPVTGLVLGGRII